MVSVECGSFLFLLFLVFFFGGGLCVVVWIGVCGWCFFVGSLSLFVVIAVICVRVIIVVDVFVRYTVYFGYWVVLLEYFNAPKTGRVNICSTLSVQNT